MKQQQQRGASVYTKFQNNKKRTHTKKKKKVEKKKEKMKKYNSPRRERSNRAKSQSFISVIPTFHAS